MICKLAEQKPLLYPPATVYFNDVTAPMILLMPPILLWSPTEQFPSLFQNGIPCPLCGDNQSNLQMYGWRDGSGASRNQPRKIHRINNIVLLVSRVYKCKRGHEISACNPTILVCCPVAELIPFQLWHITGFTMDFVNYISDSWSKPWNKW